MIKSNYIRQIHVKFYNRRWSFTGNYVSERGVFERLDTKTFNNFIFISGGVIGERSSFGHIYLKQPKGDLTPLYDVTNGSRQYLVPVNIFNNTKICLYSGFDSVTYEIFVFNSTLVPEMLALKVRKELHSFSTDCLLAGDMDSDVIFVNSSKQFGVMLIKPEVLPISGSNRALESIPNTDYMRMEFVMVTDEESEIFLMGMYPRTLYLNRRK